MKAKKPNPKTVARQVHKLVDKIKASHQPVFSIMPTAGGGMDVVKLTRAAMCQFAALKRKREKAIKYLEKLCDRVVADFNSQKFLHMFEHLAVRSFAHRLCSNRTKYLAKGKLIPGWPGNLEYQFRAMTALLLLLEPVYDDDARRPAKARHNKLQRR